MKCNKDISLTKFLLLKWIKTLRISMNFKLKNLLASNYFSNLISANWQSYYCDKETSRGNYPKEVFWDVQS